MTNNRVLDLSVTELWPKVSKLGKEHNLESAHWAALLAIPQYPCVNDDMCFILSQAEKMEVFFQWIAFIPHLPPFISTPLSHLKVPYQVAQHMDNVEFTASPQKNCGIIWHFCRRHASWSWSLSKTSLWEPSMVMHACNLIPRDAYPEL